MALFTRRQFVLSAATAATGVGAFALTRSRAMPVTGSADPRLAPFDDLMTRAVRTIPVPGASLAVARNGKLVYTRGFGYADVSRKIPVQPDSLFRIASISKSLTGVAVMRLWQEGRLNLDAPVLQYIHHEPHLAAGESSDPRLRGVTVRHCLHHTGGWDRDLSPDPSGIPLPIAEALGVSLPLSIDHVVRYGLGRRLDFDPGTKHIYSNFGYLLLGRVIETVTGRGYEEYVRTEILAPLGCGGMRLGRALPEDRAPNEVRYYDTRKRHGACLHPPRLGQPVPLPDGADNFEVYEAHGGWIASAVDLVRFASGFDPERTPAVFARPSGPAGFDRDGKPLERYYAAGWRVRPNGAGGKPNVWHAGTVWGASALMVKRGDGLSWSVLFNTDSHRDGTKLPEVIDHHLHVAADRVTEWPEGEPGARATG